MNLPHPWTAESALALISTDPGVRGVYLASYQGHDDALAALAQVAADEARIEADAVADGLAEETDETEGAGEAELRRLQDLTYGRPTLTTEGLEREQAVQRLAAIAAAEHRRRADVYAALSRMKDVFTERSPLTAAVSEPLGTGVGAGLAPGARDPTEATEATDARDARKFRRARVPSRILLLATLTAGVIIGIGLGLASAVGFEQPVSAPTTSAAESAPSDLLTLSRFPGNLTAADVWFAQTQTDADVFTGFIIFQRERIEASASRFAGTTASGWRLWVARTPSKGFCLIARRDEGPDTRPSTHRACASRVDFEKSSLRLVLDTTTVVWNGMSILTSIRW
ncbi:hypothetical protein GCM10022381_35890 [Leifsonia kafniensis]|uniref:Uncharacterized protein n=1 Tax=Leifsonia kafniensis TaxID=475957 RepID=A0ABP7L1B3_9MICO